MSGRAASEERRTHYRRIAALATDPAWPELVEELEAADKRSWDRLAHDLQRGEPVDQRTVDFMRGVQHAIRLITRQPDRAARIYERETNQMGDAE